MPDNLGSAGRRDTEGNPSAALVARGVDRTAGVLKSMAMSGGTVFNQGSLCEPFTCSYKGGAEPVVPAVFLVSRDSDSKQNPFEKFSGFTCHARAPL